MDAVFITKVVAISATGALSPGPLSVMTLALGVKGGWRSGFQVALGHTLFELPYVAFLSFLYGSIIKYLELEIIKYLLTVIVVMFNSFFAYLLISDAVRVGTDRSITPNSGIAGKFSMMRHPLLVGLILTGFNPFFLIWWATVGMPLIEGILRYNVLQSLPTMYLSHIWLDFIWLTFLAYTSSKGVKHLSTMGYKLLLILLAVMLILFAVNMSLKTFFGLSLLPF